MLEEYVRVLEVKAVVSICVEYVEELVVLTLVFVTVAVLVVVTIVG